MYKVSYYLNGGTTVKFKSFETLFEATLFSNTQPINTVIEIKHYDPVEHRKPDRN